MPRPFGICSFILSAIALVVVPAAAQQSPTASAASANPLVQEMVNAVSRDSLISYISTLQGFGTRYEYTPQRDSAASSILSTFARAGLICESDWYSVGKTTINDLDIVGENSVWAVGSSSMIVASTDGGQSWTQQSNPLSTTYYGIDFIDRLNGWAVGLSGLIIHTTNGGITWVQQSSPVTTALYDVQFVDASLGIAVGTNGVVIRTTNGGAVWSLVSPVTLSALRRAKVLDWSRMWAVGDAGKVIFSTDGGASWALQNTGVTVAFYDVDFATHLTGWVVGSGPTLCRTTDGGQTWGAVTLPGGSTSAWGSVSFPDTLEGFAATRAGVIYHSTNGGNSWIFSTSHLNLGWGPTVYALRATPGGKVVSCGSRGTLTATTDRGATWKNLTPFLPPAFLHQSRNVMATIPGRTTPTRECVVVAHYDSYSNALPSTAPGANDNASGTSAVMEAARICGRYAFNSTVRFLAVSAEESGMYGSADYVLRAQRRGDQIVAVINGDMIGYPLAGDTARLAIGSYLTRNRLIDSAMAVNSRYGIGLTLVPIIDATGASDYGPFALAGYDALDVAEGTADEIWGGADPYYHKTTDTIERLSPGMVRRGAQLMLAVLAESAGPAEHVAVIPDPVPCAFALYQNYPNPFNPVTTIRYGLPQKSEVKLTVFNLLGQEVATLVEGEQEAGYHEVRFGASGLASGVYVYRLQAGDFIQSRKLLLLR